MSNPHEANQAKVQSNQILNQLLKQDPSGETLRELIAQLAATAKQNRGFAGSTAHRG